MDDYCPRCEEATVSFGCTADECRHPIVVEERRLRLEREQADKPENAPHPSGMDEKTRQFADVVARIARGLLAQDAREDDPDTELAENAPPGAANADYDGLARAADEAHRKRRPVFRKVTEVRGVFHRWDGGELRRDDGHWLSLDDLMPDKASDDDHRIPDGPRGTFRVVVEFEPDSEE